MSSITQIDKNKRYLPHEFKTMLYAVKLYRNGNSVKYVCRKYHISKASLMRWNKKYDGTDASLFDKSHKPHTVHPNAHTDLEIQWIKNYMNRNTGISLNELWIKLKRNKNYNRYPGSLYRVVKRLGYKDNIIKGTSKYTPKNYDTPKLLGIKWQIDVKYVPKTCLTSAIINDVKLYKYTCIEEASRKRFLYWYNEQSPVTTVDFIKRTIKFFGYKPQEIQTDNGQEFTWNNGKVERSHRNDNERFYSYHSFYSLEDLRKQGYEYLKRSNNIPMKVLEFLTPNEMQIKLKNISFAN